MNFYYVCAIVTTISASVSLGFSIEALLKTSEKSGQINAMYAISRSLPLAVASIVPFFYHSNSYLIAIATLMIIIQAIDAVIGFLVKNRFKTIGPGLTAVFNFVCLLGIII